MSPLESVPDSSFDPPRRYGPWHIVERRVAYRDPWMTVRVDNVQRPDRLMGTYSTVQIKHGVCVIALDDDGTVYLTREFHYAVGRDTIEGISGGIEDDETALTAAERELQEEVGIVAGTWQSLGVVDPLTAAILSPTQLFLATELKFVETNLEGTELIQRVAMPFNEAVKMVLDSEITHGPSCVAILKVHALQLNTANKR